MASTLRNLAYAGAIAGLIGCAGTQKKVMTETAPPNATQTLTSEDCKTKRTALQICLIEAIAKECKAKTKDDDAFYACTDSKLDLTKDDYTSRTFTVEASKGDEVLSMRFGAGSLYDVAAMQVSSIDEKGVLFSIKVERVPLTSTEDRQTVQEGSLKAGFDGTISGDVMLVKQLEVYGLNVEKSKDSKVKVTCSTLIQSAMAPVAGLK
jgi:hypothetical protein